MLTRRPWTFALVLLSRVRTAVSSRRQDDEFSEEVQAHLAMLTDDNVRRGLPPGEAARQARLTLGGVAQLEERHHDARGFPQLETTMKDVRYAVRTLRQHAAYTIVATVTLAVGIGATTSMFSVLHAVLLRPLPYAAPDRLVEIFETNPLKRWTRNVVAPANFADWQRMNTVFAGMAAYNGSDDKGKSEFNVFLTGAGGEPQRLKALSVTGNLFTVLGVSPMLGRTFTGEETYDGRQRVVILSHALWRTLFSGDPHAVGRTITLTGRTYDVVGVMAPGFFFPSHDVQLWLPLGYKPSVFAESRRPHWLRVVARLRPDASIGRAREEMHAIAGRLERMYPATNTQMGVRIEGFHDALAFDSRDALLILFAAVGALFLIVCVNLASLQLGRAAGRVREIALRRALGASRGRLIRQLLTEGAVLSLLGGALGLALAIASRGVLVRTAATALPLFADLRIDRTVVLFDAALSMLAPIVFGLAPAFAASRAETLADRSESSAIVPQRTRDALVVCEVALAVVLVVTAGLLLRSLARLQQVDPGFNASHVVAFDLILPGIRYPNDADAVRAVETIERGLRAEPGFERVGASTTLALRGSGWTGDVTIEGRAPTDYERELRHESITLDYFQTLRTPLVRGRWLTAFDRPPNPPVALVNETLAKRYFRGQDAVGRRISFGRPTDTPSWVTIVGVVADVKQDGMDAPVAPEVYLPIAHEPQNALTFIVRTRVDADAALAAAREQVRAFDKDLVITDTTTLDEVVRASVDGQRFRARLLAAFAGVALFLAGLGIYGVLAYFVAQRGREMGVRLALGAPPMRLWRMVIGQGMRPVLWGALSGLAGAYALAGLLKSLLFEVAPADPLTYGSTALALVLIGLAACALPALRAVRVDPLAALRQD